MDELKARRLSKSEVLNRWREAENVNPADVVKPLRVGIKGNRFAEDGIRITGTQKFIDAVLSQLKGMLEAEYGGTRLDVLYSETCSKESGLPMDKWNCYIRVFKRGS